MEKDIQNNIIEYNKNMNGLIYKLNQINEKLCMNDNNIQQIIIAYSKNILNKETRTKHLENKYDPIIGIGNLFISFTNWWNEKSKMETYINKYLEEINDLIETNNKIFIDRVNLERQRLLKVIDNKKIDNNNGFEGLKKNRNEYRIIKNNYFKLINN